MANREEVVTRVRSLVFSPHGRVLERQVFRFFFEEGSAEPVHRAIAAYRNPDGGFGSGIEPDIGTPESSGIGLETALHYYHLTEAVPGDVAVGAVEWLEANVDADGAIAHPPTNARRYPIMPWWTNPDPTRIFAVAAHLARLGVTIPSRLAESVANHAERTPLPEKLAEYEYPLYLYAFQHESFPRRDGILADFRNRFSETVRESDSPFLLLNRNWSMLQPLLPAKTVEAEAVAFLEAVDETGRVPTGYPDLTWWDAIAVTDGLASAHRLGAL